MLSKSASQHLCYPSRSLSSQESWRRSHLLTYQFCGLLVNTLAANDKYPVLNRQILAVSIEMQLPQKQITFSHFFFEFLESTLIFRKKDAIIYLVSRKLRTPKTWFDKCPKSSVSEDPSTRKILNGP